MQVLSVLISGLAPGPPSPPLSTVISHSPGLRSGGSARAGCAAASSAARAKAAGAARDGRVMEDLRLAARGTPAACGPAPAGAIPYNGADVTARGRAFSLASARAAAEFQNPARDVPPAGG